MRGHRTKKKYPKTHPDFEYVISKNHPSQMLEYDFVIKGASDDRKAYDVSQVRKGYHFYFKANKEVRDFLDDIEWIRIPTCSASGGLDVKGGDELVQTYIITKDLYENNK